MFFDTLTTTAVCDELRAHLLGGFVQRVLRLSDHALGFEVYAKHERRWLLASAHPRDARVHLSSDKLARGSEDVSPLLLLLRKHVRDGRIMAIDQVPFERILALTIAKLTDGATGSADHSKVIIEIMGRHSNVILVDGEGLVLDSLRRVSAAVNRYRVILPHHPYVPPPPQQKVEPDRLTADSLGHFLGTLPPETLLWQGLVAKVRAMSPLLAREIAHRAKGDVGVTIGSLGATDLAWILDTIRALYNEVVTCPSPTIVREGEAIVAFAPYEVTHLRVVEKRPSVSAAIDTYYAEVERLTGSEQEKSRLRSQIEEARQRHTRRKQALEREIVQGQEAERLRGIGEAILATISSIGPGQRELEWAGQKATLDPRLSPVENAQTYFREYKKAKAALRHVPGMLAEENEVLAYLDEVWEQVELASTRDEVKRVAADLAAAATVGRAIPDGPDAPAKKQRKAAQGRPARAAAKTARSGPPPYCVLDGGFEVYVGRSARQNEEITFHVAGADDLWLHARGVPGAHVIVKARGRSVPEAAVESAARLAASFSKARFGGRVAVDCTLRAHVRRVRAGLPGLVNYTEERTLYVTPGDAR